MSRITNSAFRAAGQPGRLMRMVAEGLSAQGFKISYPECDYERCLTFIGLDGVSSSVTVSDNGRVEWECSAWLLTHGKLPTSPRACSPAAAWTARAGMTRHSRQTFRLRASSAGS